MLAQELFAEVRKLEIETNRIINASFSGEYLSAFKGRGVEFESVRPYVQGDEVRSIDWHVSARMQELHVKVFTEERELSVFLIIDTSASMYFGTAQYTKHQLATRIAALLSLAAMKNHDRAGLIFTDQVQLTIIMPRKGRSHVLRMLRELISCTPQERTTSLGATLEKAQRLLKKRSVIFVISDFYSTDYRKPLEIMTRKHDVVPIVIRDAWETELPAQGLVRLQDAETGEMLVIHTKDAQMYKQGMQAELQTLKHDLRSLCLEPLVLNTHEAYLPKVLQYFAQKTRRRQY